MFYARFWKSTTRISIAEISNTLSRMVSNFSCYILLNYIDFFHIMMYFRYQKAGQSLNENASRAQTLKENYARVIPAFFFYKTPLNLSSNRIPLPFEDCLHNRVVILHNCILYQLAVLLAAAAWDRSFENVLLL